MALKFRAMERRSLDTVILAVGPEGGFPDRERRCFREAGFELVHQSVCVQPHWIVTADADGRWAVQIEMAAKCEERTEVVDEQQVIEL